MSLTKTQRLARNDRILDEYAKGVEPEDMLWTGLTPVYIHKIIAVARMKRDKRAKKHTYAQRCAAAAARNKEDIIMRYKRGESLDAIARSIRVDRNAVAGIVLVATSDGEDTGIKFGG